MLCQYSRLSEGSVTQSAFIWSLTCDNNITNICNTSFPYYIYIIYTQSCFNTNKFKKITSKSTAMVYLKVTHAKIKGPRVDPEANRIKVKFAKAQLP